MYCCITDGVELGSEADELGSEVDELGSERIELATSRAWLARRGFQGGGSQFSSKALRT